MKHTIVVPDRVLVETPPNMDVVAWAHERTVGTVYFSERPSTTYSTDDDTAAAVLTAMVRGGWAEVERLRAMLDDPCAGRG